MAEHRPLYAQYQLERHHEPRSHQVVKTATAVAVGGSLLVLAGLTLATTVIGLTVATPVLVICSPVLVPAMITMFLLMAGFLTSGGLGVAALSVLAWIYKYLRGKQLAGADQLDHASYKLVVKSRDIKDRTEQHLPGGAQVLYPSS
ncbi:hypothetical protein NE237_028493 [Protea cynaroides]|uniref:Oleosin n=1 Tax=Protea cynaroides TaxID=273540 RepID=A0A9Q0JTW3_9MAGN|nr:hypothetical protein NE237_028493 [Protea cynaroides]